MLLRQEQKKDKRKGKQFSKQPKRIARKYVDLDLFSGARYPLLSYINV